jgi:hypothetical protein
MNSANLEFGRPLGRPRLSPGELQALSREIGQPIYTAGSLAAIAAAGLAPPRPLSSAVDDVREKIEAGRRRLRQAGMDTAIHEAGHAVVGLRLGLILSKLSMSSDGLEGVTRFWKIGEPDDDWLSATIAGALAAQIHRGQDRDGAQVFLNGPDFDEACRLTGRNPPYGTASYRNATARARGLVWENWVAIGRVAHQLAIDGTLSKADVLELMD